MKLRMSIAPLTITLLVVTACGSDDASDGGSDAGTNPTVASSSPGAATPAPDAAVSVPEALRFRAPLVGGGEFDMATLADRPVVLWFWAPY